MTFFRVLRRKWPVVVPMYQLRQCPHCAALVKGPHGQRTHDLWHEHPLSTAAGDDSGGRFPEDGWEPVYDDDDEE